MIQSQKYEFPNPQGQTLSGRLELPDSPKAFAIFAHCFTCSKNTRAASRISRELAKLGIAVLRFDFTGLGNSEGDFSNTNFSSNVSDLIAAADSLRSTHSAPQLLIGHSLGGTAVLMAASGIDEVRAVATIGSPAEPEHVTRLFDDDLQEIAEKGEYQVTLAGRPFTIRKQFLNDVQAIDQKTLLQGLKRAVLICHSPTDELVGIDQARLVYENLRHPKSFLSLDGADHMLSSPSDAEFVARMLSAWAERYVEVTEAPVSPPDLAAGELLVEEIDGFTQKVSTRDHTFLADEPVDVGGENLGMTPYDLLLAALGTCTSMTLRMYANHKKWPLEGISVRLAHHQIHARDCADCESESGKISVINKVISVAGDLTAEQLSRLEEIADRCPVHRTMMLEKKIETTLVSANAG